MKRDDDGNPLVVVEVNRVFALDVVICSVSPTPRFDIVLRVIGRSVFVVHRTLTKDKRVFGF